MRAVFVALARYSWPLVIWAAFGWLQSMISRWYLAASASDVDVANYAVVVSTSFFIPNFLYTVVAGYLLPVLFARGRALPLRSYLAIVGAFAIGLMLYTLATIPAAPLMIATLAAEKYQDMAKFVPWLTATSSLFMVASLSTMELFRAGRTKILLVPSILPGLLSLLMGFLLVPEFGLLGAVITYMIGQLVYAASAMSVSGYHLVKQERFRISDEMD